MIVISVTNLRAKRRLLVKILIGLLLILALLPFLLNVAKPASTGAEVSSIQAEELEPVDYPGDPVRVSTDFDRFWLGLFNESEGV